MRQDKQMWFLSFSDWWQAILHAKKKIALAALLLGVLLFTRQLIKPVLYKAEGTYRIAQASAPTLLSTALQGLNTQESPIGDQSLMLLNSYPVMERVVKKLDLQAEIIEHKIKNPFKRIWRQIRTEWAYSHFKSQERPLSSILHPEIVIPSRDLFPHATPPLLCQNIHYNKEYYTSLKIECLDEENYLVNGKGQAKVGESFDLDEMRFTLLKNDSSTPLKGRKFTLSFIPLSQAAKSLQKSLFVKLDKSKSSLIHIAYTHGRRDLAQNIVNETMLSYHDYLIHDGERKIENQLRYLDKRKIESSKHFEHLVDDYKNYLTQNVKERGFISVEKEIDFLSTKQHECHANLASITSKMQKIDELIDGDFSTLIDKVHEWKRNNASLETDSELLTVELATTLLANYQKALDTLELDVQKYDLLLDPTSDLTALFNTLKDPTLTPYFEKIQKLQFNLEDTQNWSQREQEVLKEELDLQRGFLGKYVLQAKERAKLETKALKEKISTLKKRALILLVEDYDDTVEELLFLNEKLSKLPQMWLKEQNLDFQKKIQSNALESLIKMIEAKNVSFQMQNITSGPLQFAPLPILPNQPHLVLFFVVGAFAGAFLVIVLLIVLEIIKGASSSAQNLKSAGFKAIDAPTTLHVAEHKIILCTYCPSSLLEKLSMRGEKVLLIELFSSSGQNGLLNYLRGETQEPNIVNNTLSLGSTSPLYTQEELICSKKFETLLASLERTYDHVFLQAPLLDETAFYLRSKASLTLYLVTNERLQELAPIASQTLFVLSQKAPESEFSKIRAFLHHQKELHLKKVIPLLQALKERCLAPFVSHR